MELDYRLVNSLVIGKNDYLGDGQFLTLVSDAEGGSFFSKMVLNRNFQSRPLRSKKNKSIFFSPHNLRETENPLTRDASQNCSIIEQRVASTNNNNHTVHNKFFLTMMKMNVLKLVLLEGLLVVTLLASDSVAW